MIKIVRWALLALLPMFILACTKLYDGEDPTEELPILPPGEVYTPQGEYNLNVVYYVPADMDSVEMWHYRLSGITLHAQNFYRQNMKRYFFDKTFGLVVNENSDYVKIHFIKSKRKSAEMKKKDVGEMAEEIAAYFEENPAEQASSHFLVYMPKFKDAAMHYAYRKSPGSTLEVPDLAFAFLGCDEKRFNIKYYASEKARVKYLSSLGEVLYQLGHAFLLTDNNERESNATYSLMGTELLIISGSHITTGYYAKYKETPDKIRLTETDAIRLNQIEVFNEEHSYTDTRVTMEEVKLEYREDTIFVKMSFRSPDKIVAAVIYNDPWRSWLNQRVPDPSPDGNPLVDTGGDAVTYCDRNLKKEGDLYTASFVLPWEDMLTESKRNGTYSKVDAEIRFSFV